MASPVPSEGLPAEEMVKVTVEGMKAITQASLRQGVKKLIYTSSIVTQVMLFGKKGEMINNESWANPYEMPGYPKSKYYAEKELWSFYSQNKDKIDVATVLPGMVVGPILGNGNISTMEKMRG